MSRIEFQTIVQHGTIELPKEYVEHVKGQVRVIILTDDIDDETDIIDYLLEHPLGDGEIKPFTRDEIYDRQ